MGGGEGRGRREERVVGAEKVDSITEKVALVQKCTDVLFVRLVPAVLSLGQRQQL